MAIITLTTPGGQPALINSDQWCYVVPAKPETGAPPNAKSCVVFSGPTLYVRETPQEIKFALRPAEEAK